MNIPGYNIESEIGHGGMSTVYLALQESLDRHVALKVMAPALAADRNFGERFLKEGRTVAKLSHPNILGIYDIGQSGHQYYMAIEYIAGGDLKQRIRQGGLDPTQALQIARQVADALGYAHDKGFVHRDVKPENVLFREDGSVVLADFGIAKALGSGTRMTGTGMSIGTPHYMSPEQARGKEVDGRSDLYSLGVVLYEMLAGQVPFDADDTFAVGLMHINDPPPRLPPSLAKLQPLLDLLLTKDPGQRYQSPGGVIAAINQMLAGQALPRSPLPQVSPQTQVMTSLPPTMGKGGSGLKWAVGGSLLATLVVAGLYFVNVPEKRSVLMSRGGAVSSSPSAQTVPLQAQKALGGGNVAPVSEPDLKSRTVQPQLSPKKQKRREIASLLQEASADVIAMRLSNPKGNNAYEKFLEVLRLEPKNANALAGLDQILIKYDGLFVKKYAEKKYVETVDICKKERDVLIARLDLSGFDTWDQMEDVAQQVGSRSKKSCIEPNKYGLFSKLLKNGHFDVAETELYNALNYAREFRRVVPSSSDLKQSLSDEKLAENEQLGQEAIKRMEEQEQSKNPKALLQVYFTSGRVTEVLNANDYTYVLIDNGIDKIWIAAPQYSVRVGAHVVSPEGMPMPNFNDKTLGRTFEIVYFVPSVQVRSDESWVGRSISDASL